MSEVIDKKELVKYLNELISYYEECEFPNSGCDCNVNRLATDKVLNMLPLFTRKDEQ